MSGNERVVTGGEEIVHWPAARRSLRTPILIAEVTSASGLLRYSDMLGPPLTAARDPNQLVEFFLEGERHDLLWWPDASGRWSGEP